ncbi:MAG: phosphoribosylamine--glycine ligase [Gammaproteobacteria bacterium]|nr:phosphoribosylamine--glycine ligase [Gammaproteobacteria bacterium]
MKVLVIGSGGREHALVWKLAQSPRVTKVYCAPGNGGTSQQAENVNIAVSDLEGLAAFAREKKIGLTVVGPEVPLVNGIVDLFQHHGLRIFGPHAAAAKLEGSKAFAKEVMVRAGVPTAPFQIFDQAAEAIAWLAEQPADKPWVVKADGIAAGKGVLICDNRAEAADAVNQIMVQREFGAAGDRIVIEERLAGYEVSLLAICSGQDILTLAPAQDYKRIGEGDTGPNTGGMGNYSPVPDFSPELLDFGINKVIAPTLQAVPFTGVLFVGLMVTEQGPQVLEYNVRFGDPETQVVLPRLENDLVDLFDAAIDGRLSEIQASWSPRKAVTVVLAAGGYPAAYQKGAVIYGLDRAGEMEDVTVFHAGTRKEAGNILTNGGRVLDVTAMDDTFAQAIDRAYEAVSAISWEGMTYRRDIAARVREK